MMTVKISVLTSLILASFLADGQVTKKSNQKTIEQLKIQVDSLREIVTKNARQSNQKVDSLNLALREAIEIERKQSLEIENLVRSSNDPSFYWSKDFIYPFILSIASAYIFWLVFSNLPEKSRRKKLRPKLELDIYHVYMDLFTIFDAVMKHNGHSPSSFQREIKGRKLTKEIINIGLQNKCLNETYLYDKNVSEHLLPLGEMLFSKSEKIDETLEKVFNFSSFLDTEEILLLERVRKQFQVYSYKSNAGSMVGGVKLMPVNPSLAYMTENLFELYNLFIQLDDLIFKFDYRNRDVTIHMVQNLYLSDKYDLSIGEIKDALTKYPKDKAFFDSYYILSEFKRGHKSISYSKLKEFLSSRPNLLSHRHIFEEIIQDDKVLEILAQDYKPIEIDELKELLNTESQLKSGFQTNNEKFKQYYIEKSKALSKKKVDVKTTNK